MPTPLPAPFAVNIISGPNGNSHVFHSLCNLTKSLWECLETLCDLATLEYMLLNNSNNNNNNNNIIFPGHDGP